MRFSRRRFLAAAPAACLATSLALHSGRAFGEEPADAAEPSAAPSGEESHGFEEFTRAADKSIERGTEWMVKTMHRDGGCGTDIGQPVDIGCTSMVGLALLAQGNTPVEGPRSRELRQIVSFLLRKVDTMPSDDVTSETHTQLQNKIGRHAHSFFCALFLSQVVGEGSDPEPVRRALKRVIEAIVSSQHDGHWGQQSWAPVLGTVMGWVSLRAADFAGIKVGSSPDATANYLIQQMKGSLGNEGGGNWMHTLYKNATGIRVLYAMGRDGDPIATKAFEDVVGLVTRDNTPFSQAGGEEYLAFHLITETMLQKGGKDWATWYPNVRDKIIAVQNSDGSWTGKHCITSRTFCTAASILVLTAPNRYLPISQP